MKGRPTPLLLPTPTLFDLPQFRVLVRWAKGQPEVCATTATNQQEADDWLSILSKGKEKPHSIRLEAIQILNGGEPREQ